ncbi:A24 family peptidase [Candidatus Woesearchaeota archaeon]|nr:A24 family peptidase [Candidatus Woesearchaeota archaeon]
MINITLISIIVGFVAVLIASLFDIKTREVPDWLNYSLIGFAVGSSLILAVYHGYTHILINSLVGLGIGLAIALLMFYTGQWGGGDSKLIIGLSALIGFGISDLKYGFPLLVIFFINIMIVGAVYGLLFSFAKAILNFRDFKLAAEKKLRSRQVLVMRIILIIICVSALIFFLATMSVESVVIFLLAVALFIFFYMWLFVSLVEKTCMIKQIKVKDLTEGDWVVSPVTKKKGRKERVILKPTRIGVTLKQIALLKKHSIRKVTVKIGVPFVPSFLIAYVLTFALGNWLVYFL